METRTQFHEDIQALFNSIRKMSVLAAEALSDALRALDTRDTVLAAKVIEEDARIDKLQEDIETMCIRILATQQPVAGDLRTVITAIKIVAHLERIGDHGRHFAMAVTKDIPEKLIRPVFDVMQDLADRGILMIHGAIDAFVQHDEAAARKVAAMDNDIDRRHKDLSASIVEIMKKEPDTIEAGVRLYTLSRFLERLGDHVTDMCEWIVFLEQAKRVDLNP